MITIIQKGGFWIWPILACSVVALAIILERFYHLTRLKIIDEEQVLEIKNMVADGGIENALKICANSKDPIKRLMEIFIHAIGRSTEEKEKILKQKGSRILRELNKNLNALVIIGDITPLMGLLGTVTGMMKAFMKIQEIGGKVNASVLAGGIWEALITTAAGLSVAIPTLMFFHYFERKVNDIADRMKDTSGDLLYMDNIAQSKTFNGFS